jgi:hypothetical protein
VRIDNRKKGKQIRRCLKTILYIRGVISTDSGWEDVYAWNLALALGLIKEMIQREQR